MPTPMPWMLSAIALLAAAVITPLLKRKLGQRRSAALLRISSRSGIVEEGFVPIGGIHQWIGIRGESRDNPVLLLLHGGPGSSYSMFTPHLRPWEKHFTIVQWDQRGAGRTFRRNGPAGSGALTLEQLTRDGIEVAEYGRRRLGKDRIILLASSFGSTFGLAIAKQRPDLFHAYVGTDQNTGMVRGMTKAHNLTIERLQAHGQRKGVRILERIGADPARWTAKDFETTARWRMKSDPESYPRTMQLLKDAIWRAPDYGIADIRSFVAGMHFSLQCLFPEIPAYDAWRQGTRFEVPFFLIQGETDVVTPTWLAQEFFADVDAPQKKMVLIPRAGHFAAFLEPAYFLEQLLSHVRPLALERVAAIPDGAALSTAGS